MYQRAGEARDDDEHGLFCARVLAQKGDCVLLLFNFDTEWNVFAVAEDRVHIAARYEGAVHGPELDAAVRERAKNFGANRGSSLALVQILESMQQLRLLRHSLVVVQRSLEFQS